MRRPVRADGRRTIAAAVTFQLTHHSAADCIPNCCMLGEYENDVGARAIRNEPRPEDAAVLAKLATHTAGHGVPHADHVL